MKKIIALLLALIMVFALVACGSSNTPSTPSNPSTPAPGNPTTSNPPASQPAEEPKTVAFVGFGPGDFFDMLANTYIATMKAEGWNAEYTSGNFDPPTQIAAAENYIAMGVEKVVFCGIGGFADEVDAAQVADGFCSGLFRYYITTVQQILCL